MSKTYCPYPFNGVSLQPNNMVLPCGQYMDSAPFQKIIPINEVRNSEYINDGKISNLYGTVPKKGTLLGVVQGVYLENTKGGLLGITKGDGKATNPVTKKPYNWVKIKLADAVYNDIQKNQRNFITRDLFKTPNVYVFVREDAIKL